MLFSCSRKIKCSVYKAVPVLKLIQGASVPAAILQLQFLNKSIAQFMLNILKSAIANSRNNNISRLYISEVKLSKDISLKRSKPRSKGNVSRINKPYVRIKIFLKAII